MDNFRRVFRVAMKEVLTVYRSARVEEGERQRARVYLSGGYPIVREPALVGLTLHTSPPPVRKLLKLPRPFGREASKTLWILPWIVAFIHDHFGG